MIFCLVQADVDFCLYTFLQSQLVFQQAMAGLGSLFGFGAQNRNGVRNYINLVVVSLLPLLFFRQ